MRLLHRRKITLLLLLAFSGSASAQEAAMAGACMLCRQAQFLAADLMLPGGNGKYKPPHKTDPFEKVMNWYKPNGDEAGDREGFNVHEIGRKQVYFGIALGFNAADYRIVRKPYNSLDTIRTINSSIGPGFNLGIIGNWQFHKYFDLRLIPTLSFSDKTLNYTTILRQTPSFSETVSSIYLDFPLQLRFKSDPIRNTRVYVIVGGRYDYDLASNSTTRQQNLIKVGKNDVDLEYGIGVMIYFPYFIMSPEFKMSQGLLNVNSPTQNFVYSTVLQKLFSRIFTITLNLEG